MAATATRRPVLGLGALAALVGATLGYSLAVDAVVTSPQQLLYPLVWVGASLAALQWLVRPHRRALGPLSLAVGTAYTVGLLAVAGLVGPGMGAPSMAVHYGLPGWSPTVLYRGAPVRLTLVPFLALGYATLGLLVAVAVGRARRSAALGAFGLFACVSCAAPLVASLAGALGAGQLAAGLAHYSYPVATAVFATTLVAFAVAFRRLDAV